MSSTLDGASSGDTVTVADLRPALSQTGTQHWTLRYEGAECKFVMKNDTDALIYHLYVPPCERGRGIGSATMALALETLEAEGVTRVSAEIRAADGATQHLFRKYGFSVDVVEKTDPVREVVTGTVRLA